MNVKWEITENISTNNINFLWIVMITNLAVPKEDQSWTEISDEFWLFNLLY